MILTQRQLDVLNHVVVDGQAWADNAKEEAHVLAKIAKYEASYDQAVAQGNYKNRATRDEDERVAKLPTPMQTWERQMAKSDLQQMSRALEDHLRDDHGGVAGNAQLQAKYDAKVALRNTKPS